MTPTPSPDAGAPDPSAAPSVPTGADLRRGPLREGDRVQLTDPRGRLHTITLAPGGQFHTHKGFLLHDDLLGQPEGSVVRSTAGIDYLALRPLLSDYVLSMPRGAAVVYPKDAGQIVAMADIYPGARVVEAGVGSGALTMSLLRAVGDGGSLHSIERREDFAAIARGNVELQFGGPHPAWTLSVGDLSDVLPSTAAPGSVDRVVLDMLAPWENLEAVATALAPGGVVMCYVATVTQLSRTAEAMRADGRFTEPDASETMVRGWHVEGLAVRPDHRMVAHTGFLLSARRLADGSERLAPKRRASKSEYSEDDLQAWTPVALGERDVTDKKLRRAGREALGLAERAARAIAPADPATTPAAGPAEASCRERPARSRGRRARPGRGPRGRRGAASCR